MKIHLVGVELLDADRQDMMELIVAFRNYVHAPKPNLTCIICKHSVRIAQSTHYTWVVKSSQSVLHSEINSIHVTASSLRLSKLWGTCSYTTRNTK
jgi:hypothetical protein